MLLLWLLFYLLCSFFNCALPAMSLFTTPEYPVFWLRAIGSKIYYLQTPHQFAGLTHTFLFVLGVAGFEPTKDCNIGQYSWLITFRYTNGLVPHAQITISFSPLLCLHLHELSSVQEQQ